MKDHVFELLLRVCDRGYILNGQNIQEEGFSLPQSKMEELYDAYNHLIQEKFISPNATPGNVNHATPYSTTNLGREALEKEKQKRSEIIKQQEEKVRLEGLQVQLLHLSIESAKSTLETNKSLQETNVSNRELTRETKSYYTQLKWATWVIAGATIVNVGIAALPYIFKGASSKDSQPQQLIQAKHHDTLTTRKGQTKPDSLFGKTGKNDSTLKK